MHDLYYEYINIRVSFYHSILLQAKHMDISTKLHVANLNMNRLYMELLVSKLRGSRKNMFYATFKLSKLEGIIMS